MTQALMVSFVFYFLLFLLNPDRTDPLSLYFSMAGSKPTLLICLHRPSVFGSLSHVRNSELNFIFYFYFMRMISWC